MPGITITRRIEAPRRYALGCENHLPLSQRDALHARRLRHDGPMSFETMPLSLMAKVLSVLTRPMMKKVMTECGKDLDDLKTAAEKG